MYSTLHEVWIYGFRDTQAVRLTDRQTDIYRLQYFASLMEAK